MLTYNQKLALNRYKQQRRKQMFEGIIVIILFVVLCLASAYTTYI